MQISRIVVWEMWQGVNLPCPVREKEINRWIAFSFILLSRQALSPLFVSYSLLLMHRLSMLFHQAIKSLGLLLNVLRIPADLSAELSSPWEEIAARSDCPLLPLHAIIGASVFQELRDGLHLAEIHSVPAVRSAWQKFYILSVCHQKIPQHHKKPGFVLQHQTAW